ncbi:MAG: hypothetical protein AAF842_06445 [Planctomycetota bacterium]
MPGPTNLQATMITTTTYGSWLPGDLRGYVDDGRVLPPDPAKLNHARELMKGDPVRLNADEQSIAFDALLSACDEYNYRLLAVSIESWHAHILLHHGHEPVSTTAARLKAAVRVALDRGRIWTTGYDKRYCFTPQHVDARRQYIARHPGHRPIPPTRP